MKVYFAQIIILGLLLQTAQPMLQTVMKIAGEQLLILLVKAAINAVRSFFMFN
jgi:hypothetical protein